MATTTCRDVLLGAFLLISAAALAAPCEAAPRPEEPAEAPVLERGVVREEFPVWTTPAKLSGNLSRRPHRVPPPLEEVVVFSDSLEGRALDDDGGWTHSDASGEPAAWHIDSLLACQGKAWWCGIVDSSWIYDSNRAGYANSWTHYLENSVRLDTIPAGTVARIGFRHTFSAEKDYDYGRLQALDLTFGWVELATFTGEVPSHGSCDTFSVAIPESIRVQYYQDPGNPLPVYFRFVFESDIGFSSADGLYDGDGWTIDNITVRAGAQVRFFDNCENGIGNWSWTVLPPVGDFFALSNNVTTEDLCTDNRSNVWTCWDPVVQSLIPRINNLLNTPAVGVNRADRVVVNFDVYRNLPLNACFYYHLNYRSKNIGAADWGAWTDPTRLLYYGATKDWARQKIVLPGAAGKDSVMVQLAITDFGRCLHTGHVDRARALGAAKDQHPQRRAGRCLIPPCRIGSKKLGPHGIAGDETLAKKERKRRLIGHRGGAHQRREQPIGQARDGVLLQQQRGNPTQCRRGDDGPRAVPPDANHEIRFPA